MRVDAYAVKRTKRLVKSPKLYWSDVGLARHLLTFEGESGKAVRGGLVLHTGNEIFWLAEGTLAAPWWRVL